MSKGLQDHEKKLTKAILQGSAGAAAWIFSSLMDIGEITAQVFLNPSYYGDLPGGRMIKLPVVRKNKKFKDITIRQSISRLQKIGFVEKREGRIILTLLGKKLAKQIKLRKKNAAKKWDGKYRIVIFDIPEKKRKDRDWLRGELYFLKYKQLQKSVLIGKNSLPLDIIKDIKRRRLGNYVNYILVDKIYTNII